MATNDPKKETREELAERLIKEVVAEETALDLLEQLLSITEQFKEQMDAKTLRAWRRISAAEADLRDPSLLDESEENSDE